MHAYSISYLNDIVENQGKLFDYFSNEYSNKDTKDFINFYMKSDTRKAIDDCQAYVCTKNAKELWDYFYNKEEYKFKEGTSLKGFLPDWIGEFYAYYQWYYNIPSKEVIDKVPLEFLIKAYHGLHDLDLKLAVEKVGNE